MPEEAPAIGCFLCDCGTGISKVVDFDKLSSFCTSMGNVKFAKKHSYLCSDEGVREILTATRDGVNRIVIGACSPKLYELFFKYHVKRNGFNPNYIEMVNIREQCAWPHVDNPTGAYQKAERLLAATVKKVEGASPIESKKFEISKSVLVVGGGVAGLQAAICVADFGYKVHLVERAPTIGGAALKLGLAFPTDDGAFCISPPDFLPGTRKCFYRAGLLQHPNIEIHTLSQLESLRGSIGNFEATIVTQPRGVSEKLCTNCKKCEAVCPFEVLDERNYGLSKRKAIYLPHPNSVPPAYVIDWQNCDKCGKCVEVCDTKAINLSDERKEAMLNIGAIIIATGIEEYDPSRIKRYGFGVHKDVLTQLQFAQILSPDGPTGGRLLKPSNSSDAKRIVMIQCVGSRDESNPDCSRVCCTIALKHAVLIKEKYAPDAQIYVCYMEMRPLGKGYEEYFDKARKLGVRFIRGKPSEIYRETDGTLIVDVEDTLLNRPLEIEADLVILSAGLVPAKGSRELAEKLGVKIGRDGFIQEIYSKLKPVETGVKGIYVCGGAQGPKDIPESITQAESAAYRVILDLSKGFFEKDLATASVHEEDCDGCKLCVDACPRDAIEMKDRGKGEDALVATVNEVKCSGCGTCTSRCPTGAVQLRHHTDDQLLGYLQGLLSDVNKMSPKIVAFCCDECGYATLDMVGMDGFKYPPNILTTRVPCLGAVSLYHIFKAFEYGADGILMLGCEKDKCQQSSSSGYQEKVTAFTKDILDEIGLSGERLKTVFTCAATPKDFLDAASSLMNRLEEIGPLPKPSDISLPPSERLERA